MIGYVGLLTNKASFLTIDPQSFFVSQESLNEALNGLINAVEYAEDIGEDELAREISSMYQTLSARSPEQHWDDVKEYTVHGTENATNIIDDIEGAHLFDKGFRRNGLGIYATKEAVSEIEESPEVKRIEGPE